MISIRLFALAGLLCFVSAKTTKQTTKHSTTSSTKTTSSTSTSTYTPPPVPTIGEYGQCGGQGYTAGTVCPIDWVCTVANAFFSQCLPGPNFTFPSTTSYSATTTVPPVPRQTFNYVVSFGDSYTETGFNLSGTKPAIGNQLGNPAYPGLTTSGGPNWLGDLLSANTWLLSYNFASGGSTIDASIVAPKVTTALSLVDQVAEFTSNFIPPPAYAPWVANDTVFIIWSGNTDLFIAYNQSNFSTLCQELVDSYFAQVEILYNVGANSFIFMEAPPLQSTPAMLAKSAADQQAMANAITQFNNLFNSAAAAFINDKLDGFQYPLADWQGFAQVVDTQDAFQAVIDNPTGNGAPNASCYNPDGVSCLWADEYSPGQEIQSLVFGYTAEIVGWYL